MGAGRWASPRRVMGPRTHASQHGGVKVVVVMAVRWRPKQTKRGGVEHDKQKIHETKILFLMSETQTFTQASRQASLQAGSTSTELNLGQLPSMAMLRVSLLSETQPNCR